jgi:hypothetical protein
MNLLKKNKYRNYFSFDIDQFSIIDTNSPNILAVIPVKKETDSYYTEKYKDNLLYFLADGKYEKNINVWLPRRIGVPHNIRIYINLSTCNKLNQISDYFIFKLHIVESLYRAVLSIDNKIVRDDIMTNFDNGNCSFFKKNR